MPTFIRRSPRPRRGMAPILLLGALAPFGLPALGSAGVAGPALSSRQAGDEAPKRPSVEVGIELETLDGERVIQPAEGGPIRSLKAKGAAFARFLGVAPMAVGEGSIAPLDRASFELSGGDRLSGKVVGGDGDLLKMELTGGVPLELSIDGIRSILMSARIPASVTDSPVGSPDGDRLYLRAGTGLDRAEGLVEAFTDEGIVFEDARLGSRTFAWDRVVALFVTPLEDDGAPGEVEEGAEEGERVAVSLVGGGRIGGRLLEITGPDEGLRIVIGEDEVQLPGSVVTEVVLDDGSFRFLGDVQPTDRGSESPFGDDLGFRWPMRVDRNCRGGRLLVGGETFDRGLGVHAPSQLTWVLDQPWKELRLACGMDDSGESGDQGGAARFRVLGDGKELWTSDVLRAGSSAIRPAPIDLKGIRSLVLEVDAAGDFVLDRANWLRPMLVR